MTDYDAVFSAHRDHIWGLLYRMLGSAAEADDLVQDTFERAMTKPPADVSRPWRPWLVCVATNLGRDALRARKRRPYIGPWLPEPTERTLNEGSPTPEARYGARESASYAFLKAIEVLTPDERAVLVLRDVFDYSTRETAEALEVSESNAKVLLHRARKAMKSYDESGLTLDPDDVGEVLGRLMTALLAGDAEAVAGLLAEQVVFTSDAGGEFTAALRPVVGADKVSRFLFGLLGGFTDDLELELVERNGAPALFSRFSHGGSKTASRALYRIDVAADRIVAIDVILASGKL